MKREAVLHLKIGTEAQSELRVPNSIRFAPKTTLSPCGSDRCLNAVLWLRATFHETSWTSGGRQIVTVGSILVCVVAIAVSLQAPWIALSLLAVGGGWLILH